LKIRLATLDDLEELLEIADNFISETEYDIVYSRKHSANHYSQYISIPQADIILAVEDRIVGVVLIGASSEFQEQPFCYIAKFFVHPEGRRTPAARLLNDAIKIWAKFHDCSHIFVTATAGLNDREQRLFINLMKKAGYKEQGPCMILGVNDE